MICCRGTAQVTMHAMRNVMNRLWLTVNDEMTRISRPPEESFDFLG